MIEYREIVALNQSTLKKILISPKEYLKSVNQMETSTGEHFVFGTVVDLMLTSNKEEFDEKFIVLPNKISISDTVKTIVDGINRDLIEKNINVDTLYDDACSNIILQNCQYLNYQANWKADTRVNKIQELGDNYFKFLKKANNRQVVNEDDYNKAVLCVSALKQDPYTKPYVDSRMYKDKDTDDVEFKNKVVVQFNYMDLEFKGELDRVVINHTKKLIIPIDFKTTSKSILGFNYDFWKYRYDFQAATYRLGLEKESWVHNLIKEGYFITDFLYIVVEKDLYNNPMCFQVPNEIINIGRSGGEVFGNNYEGLDNAIVRYKYASENNHWDYPMEYYKDKGVMIIKNI